MQGGAIDSLGSEVLLVQTLAESNTPDHYSGSTFIHHCYDGFYHNVDTVNCDPCPAGTYKSFALFPDALSCKDCPEVLCI
jgi:hypothetical protein